jgi:hypothetical protein
VSCRRHGLGSSSGLGTWWLSFSDGRCGQRRVDEARLLGLV